MPQSLISLDGTACNMVGTSYTAFLNQPVRLAFFSVLGISVTSSFAKHDCSCEEP